MQPAILVFLSGACLSAASAQCKITHEIVRPSVTVTVPSSTPLSMLAFGTSLMWGDGLLQESTFRFKVADWVALKAARPVHLVTFAHSAALLGASPTTAPENPNPDLADLNDPRPTVEEQIQCAAGMHFASDPGLVLIEGCINEVGAESIAYPWTNTDDLGAATRQECDKMLTELKSVRQHFPSSLVIVVGYYPLVSQRSSLFGFSGTKRLAKRSVRIYDESHPNNKHLVKAKHSRSEERNILVRNSEQFYQISKQSLSDAVKMLGADGDDKVHLATLPETAVDSEGKSTVDPRFAYGGPKRHLWMIPVRFLWFWAFYKDQKYWPRERLCARYRPFGVDRIICESSPAFHPNVQGAETYAESIESLISPETLRAWRLP